MTVPRLLGSFASGTGRAVALFTHLAESEARA